jgi:oligopeptide transport system substrate-binding protein
VFWSDGQGFHARNTAHDFVFGFARLFNPALKSHNSAEYFAIANSRMIREGRESELGVYAPDDFTLVILLERPEPDFPVLLTRPPAFPTNFEFWELTAGRYGLIGAESPLASNGEFVLREWVYDPWWQYENRIILRRNGYNDCLENRIFPRGIDYLLDRTPRVENFIAGDSDCIVISGAGAQELLGAGFAHTAVESAVIGLHFNDTYEESRFGNADLRRALILATDISAIGIESAGYRTATEQHSDFNPAAAAELFREVSYLVSASRPVVIVPVSGENDVVLSYVHSINQQWQRHLALFCEIVPLSSDEFARRYADGDFDIAAIHTSFSSLNESPTESVLHFAYMTEFLFYQEKVEGLVYNPHTGAIEFRSGRRI